MRIILEKSSVMSKESTSLCAQKEKKRTEKKSCLFFWLIFVIRVRLLHITHALVSTSSFPLCYCGGRVLRILQCTGVWCALVVCAQRDRHREAERKTETEDAGEEIDRRRTQRDEENRSSCIGMMVAEEN
jgi:hypothetical protein